jgi:hypothetical protein
MAQRVIAVLALVIRLFSLWIKSDTRDIAARSERSLKLDRKRATTLTAPSE